MLNASLNSLPLDTLVQIICKLNHDELEPLVGVSKSFREAVGIARTFHFDYSTPAPRPGGVLREIKATPDAPVKHEVRRQLSKRLSEEESQKLAVVLFPEIGNQVASANFSNVSRASRGMGRKEMSQKKRKFFLSCW